MRPQDISIDDYSYALPEERIAKYPLEQRDCSQLLVASNEIQHLKFHQIDSLLPVNSIMFFNDTKVFHARMHFHKNSGARIEIFLLEPLWPTPHMEDAFDQRQKVVWKCLVGNKKKWKEGKLQKKLSVCEVEVLIEVSIEASEGNAHHIGFSWEEQNITFGDIVESLGSVPLPPYMQREAESLDDQRYQTVYARQKSSVAAPTAGLHFTPETLNRIEKKGIQIEKLTLDVGAGTFKPVKAKSMQGHQMHSEKIHFTRESIQNLRKALGDKKVISVGTTSTRSLESLYWFGQKLNSNKDAKFVISQWEAYSYNKEDLISSQKALDIILEYMDARHEMHLNGETQLIIAPSYSFKFVDILVTNFHQPKSTLLLLVAAFYGPKWKSVYQEALSNQYRFLSYGDSCIFFRNENH